MRLPSSAETLAALLEVVELVEARARRREEHDLPRLGVAEGLADGRLEVAEMRELHACRDERLGELVRGLADQVRARTPALRAVRRARRTERPSGCRRG